jgi:hypothetical protein
MMTSYWIVTYIITGELVRKTLVFLPVGGFAGARDVVEAIARFERPEVQFPFGKNRKRTARQVMKWYHIEDTIRHRPDFSAEEAKLSTDETSCNAWEPLKVRYGT